MKLSRFHITRRKSSGRVQLIPRCCFVGAGAAAAAGRLWEEGAGAGAGAGTGIAP